jgi:hypothetical protein
MSTGFTYGCNASVLPFVAEKIVTPAKPGGDSHQGIPDVWVVCLCMGLSICRE